jgi:hypothetical protein
LDIVLFGKDNVFFVLSQKNRTFVVTFYCSKKSFIMKKISLIVCMFALMCGNLFAQGHWELNTEAFDESGAYGSSAYNPILIQNEKQLAYLAIRVNNGYVYTGRFFRLEKDLDLGVAFWTPIGEWGANWNDASKRFSGRFNGNGKTIKNLMNYNSLRDCQIGRAHV